VPISPGKAAEDEFPDRLPGADVEDSVGRCLDGLAKAVPAEIIDDESREEPASACSSEVRVVA
jgi:hypothetical protein